MRGTAAGLFLAASAGGAAEADGWSVFAFLSQRFEADSNIQLDSTSDGEAFGATTLGTVDFVSRTSRSEFRLSPGFRATGFLGDGANSDQNLIAPNFSGALSHRVAAVDFSGGVQFDIRPTAFSEFDDFGDGASDPDLVDQNAISINFNANSQVGYRIDERNRVTAGSLVSVRRFTADADSLTPSTTIGANAGFSHSLSSTTTTDIGAGARRVRFGGAQDDTSVIFDLDAGVSTEINPGFTLGGRFGVNFTDTDRGVGVDETGAGYTFSLNAGYAVNEALRFGVSAAQSLEPGSDGELQERLRIAANTAWTINTREQLSLGVNLSRQSSGATAVGGGTSSVAQTTLGYRFAITPEVSADIGYAFRWRPDEGDEATSHKIFLTFSRSFTLQP